MRNSRWLIFAPVAILALFANTAHAEPVQGLVTYYYTIDAVPPTKSDTAYLECGSEIENNINRSYDGEPYLDCTGDLFMVHMVGTVIIPVHDTIEFWLASDDGGTINIGGNEWGNWSDQGCSWMESGQLQLSAGNQPLDLWMYENGGGTCIMLAWNIDNQGFAIVPDEAFTTSPQETTTTTTSTTTTTVPVTTTTMQGTTTTWASTTTSTTATTTTVTTTAPTTTVPATTTTSTTQVITPPVTSTTVYEAPVTTTTTTVQETTTTALTPDTQLVQEETTTTTTLQQSEADQSTTSTTQVEPVTQSTDEITVPQIEPITTVDEPVVIDETVLAEAVATVEALVELVASLDNATVAQVAAVIEAVLEQQVSVEQATVLASSAEVLAVVSEAQAEQIFEALQLDELPVEQLAEVIEAVQSAPTEVRQAFELVINIFDGAADTYVPLNSTIPVGERRVVVAVTGIIIAGASVSGASQQHMNSKTGK